MGKLSKAAGLVWFWLVVAVVLVVGLWPGAEWASILLWLSLTGGLFAFFAAVGFLWYVLPERRAQRRRARI